MQGTIAFLRKERDERLLRKWQARQTPFRYAKTPEERLNSFTYNNRAFFKVQKDLNNYYDEVSIAAAILRGYLRVIADDAYRWAFRRWRKVTSTLIESMVVGTHFRDSVINYDDLPNEPLTPRDSVDYPIPDTFQAGMLRTLYTSPDISVPTLPDLHVERSKFGELFAKNPPSFNSFRSRMSGPTDYSFWVVSDSCIC